MSNCGKRKGGPFVDDDKVQVSKKVVNVTTDRGVVAKRGSNLSNQRSKEYSLILLAIKSVLMPVYDTALIFAPLPVYPLLELIAWYAIDRFVTSIGSIALNHLATSTLKNTFGIQFTLSLISSDGDHGLWLAPEVCISDDVTYRDMSRQNEIYHLNTLVDDRFYQFDCANTIKVNSHPGIMISALCIDPSRGRVYTAHYDDRRWQDVPCLVYIRMVEKGVVSDVVEIDSDTHISSMLFSPLNSEDGSIIFSDSVDNRLVKLCITERVLDVLIVDGCEDDKKNKWRVHPRRLCWARSSSLPFTHLYVQDVAHSSLELFELETRKLEVGCCIKLFAQLNYDELRFDCTSNGILIISTKTHVFSFNPRTGDGKRICGGAENVQDLDGYKFGELTGDPLTEITFGNITSITCLENELAVAVADGHYIRRVPLTTEMCSPQPQTIRKGDVIRDLLSIVCIVCRSAPTTSPPSHSTHDWICQKCHGQLTAHYDSHIEMDDLTNDGELLADHADQADRAMHVSEFVSSEIRSAARAINDGNKYIFLV